jgi:hypothetical protein
MAVSLLRISWFASPNNAPIDEIGVSADIFTERARLLGGLEFRGCGGLERVCERTVAQFQVIGKIGRH